MRILAFIEDQQIVKKILQHLDLWHVKRKPPAPANGPPADTIIIYDESSAPSTDDYLTPLEAGLSDCNLPLKKSSFGQSGELCPKLAKYSTPAQKIDKDNKAHLR